MTGIEVGVPESKASSTQAESVASKSNIKSVTGWPGHSLLRFLLDLRRVIWSAGTIIIAVLVLDLFKVCSKKKYVF